MSQLIDVPFRKMNGLGNEFVILDLRGNRQARPTEQDAIALANPATGPGCDQLITIEDARSKADDAFMGIWNADGSAAGACGNAARCVAHILMSETGADTVRLDSPSGPLRAWQAPVGPGGEQVRVDMGKPKFGWRDIPLSEQVEDTRFLDVKLGPIDAPVLWGPSGVNIGNPHCVFFVKDVNAHAIDRFGPMIEHHPLFPERVNVSIVEARDRRRLRVRVWERGAGLTKACGTGACAALVAANRRRLVDRVATVELDGGPLRIEWADDDHVYMTGPVAYEFEGIVEARHLGGS
ncbi:MAG: diaminopimelate epimerase [Alphaproteobacteria bacterium]|nr:diaminopimelate epimerase [Alphaproteobacteria bacterium]